MTFVNNQKMKTCSYRNWQPRRWKLHWLWFLRNQMKKEINLFLGLIKWI